MRTLRHRALGARHWGALLVLALAAPVVAQQPTFRAGVTLVTTDVIVRDGDGRFVSNLTKDDFKVAEDDQPQDIASFVLVNGGRVFSMLEPTPPSSNDGIVLPPRRPSQVNSESGRVFLIFIDDLHFEPEYTPHVRRLVQQLVDNLLHDGDIVGMVSSGPSAIEINPTLDRKLIAAAATKIRGSQPTAEELFKMLESSQGPGDIRFRAQVAFQTMYNMVGSLDEVKNRRKAIIYISTGYDFDPFLESRHSQDRIMGGRFSDPLRFTINEDNPYFRMGTVT